MAQIDSLHVAFKIHTFLILEFKFQFFKHKHLIFEKCGVNLFHNRKYHFQKCISLKTFLFRSTQNIKNHNMDTLNKINLL